MVHGSGDKVAFNEVRVLVDQLSDRELKMLREAYHWIASDEEERKTVSRFYLDLADAITDVLACRMLRSHLPGVIAS
jgi:hypothetical protein